MAYIIIILLIVVIILQAVVVESLLKIARQESGYVLENLKLHRKIQELTEKNNELNK